MFFYLGKCSVFDIIIYRILIVAIEKSNFLFLGNNNVFKRVNKISC